MSAAFPATIYVAPVVTMDADRPMADAFAVLCDRIVGVGSVDEVRALVGADASVVELSGVVLPGLIDAHLHMERGGLKALSYLPEDATLAAFIETMRRTFHDADWAGAEPPTLDERVKALDVVQPWLHALGITGVVDPASTIDEMRGYQEAHRRGRLTMRTLAMPYLPIGTLEIPDVDAAITHLDGTGVSTGFGDDMLRVGPIKVYADGEALKGQAYLDEPWDSTGYRGLQRIEDAEFARLVDWCANNGWGVGTHAVGSAAIAAVTAAYRAAGPAVVDRRFQLIHAYLEPSLETIRAAAEARVIASLQPSIIWHNGRGLRAKLGDRAEHANPVRSWLDAGATVAFGSDGPFFPFDPRHLIWQAVTRRVEGEDQPLSMDEAITVDDALAAYTTGAAYAAMADDHRGMIREGYIADWALWEADPRSIAIDDLRRLRVLRTDVGGRTVYRRAA
ncbi:hypothetical protein GCM10009808_01290 [Microbacterium sediminicola]|uniref:Amidohydrolase 3 domain-containing protein n=1 Tax=Microbacterium sediminicola TaxID=415210 RepID=A0ABN2HHI7_9MICO